jgi:hypothetical protein
VNVGDLVFHATPGESTPLRVNSARTISYRGKYTMFTLDGDKSFIGDNLVLRFD